MKSLNAKLLVKCILGCALLASAAASYAASATQNITLTGTITPPPLTCSFQGSPSISFNGPIDPNQGFVSGTSPANISITCSAGASYSLTSALDYNPVTVGGIPASVVITSDGLESIITSVPITGSGNGAAQIVKIYGTLLGDMAMLDPAMHIGAVTGTVQLILTY